MQRVRHKFTIDEYHQMIETGILKPDARVELIEGEILHMTAMNSTHAACIDRIVWHLGDRLQKKAIIRVQNPIRIDQYSEPEPDVALLQLRADFYAAAHPEPEDVLLLIEVSQASLGYDRQVKIPLYAQAGIPEVWLVDLDNAAVEVYRQPLPQNRTYQHRLTFQHGQTLSPQALPHLTLATDELLG